MAQFSWDKQLKIRNLVFNDISYKFRQYVGMNIKDIVIEIGEEDEIQEVVDIYFDRNERPLTNDELMNYIKEEMKNIEFSFVRMEKLVSCGYIEYHMYFMFDNL